MPDAPVTAMSNAATAEAPPASEKQGQSTQPPAKEAPPRKEADSAFDELDRLANDGDDDAKAKKPVAKKPDATKDDEPPQAGEKPKDEAGEAPAKKEDQSKVDKEPKSAPELRAAYAASKKRIGDLEKQVEEFKAKAAVPAEDPEKKVLVERLTEREKRIHDLEHELSYVSFEKTDEYKQKYHQPFVTAYNDGIRRVMSLKVEGQDGAERPATKEDFDSIVTIADDNEAVNRATEMFGNKAPIVLMAREKVIDANENRRRAIEDHRKTAEDREKSLVEQQAKQKADHAAQAKASAERFEKLNAEAAEKYPQFFKPADGDDERNSLLERGFAFVDRAFKPDGKTPPEEMVRIHSVIRNKAAAFDSLALMLRRAKAENKELLKKIEGFANSESAGGGRGRPSKAGGYATADDELDAIASRNG